MTTYQPKKVGGRGRNGPCGPPPAQIPIASRIEGDTQRPSLTAGKSFIDGIEEVLRERKLLYRQAADHVIPTDDLSPDGIADAILAVAGEPKGVKR